MTDKKPTAPHPAAAHDAAHPKPKAAPRPAPRAPIPSVTFEPTPPQNKGKIALAVAATLGAGALIGHAVVGLGRTMLRRGRG